MELLCGKCGRTQNFEPDQAGRACYCLHCGHTIHVPAAGGSQPTGGDDCPPVSEHGDAGEDEFLTKARLMLQRKVLVICGSCGERLKVEQRLCGKVLRCPACGRQINIPLQSDDDHLPDVAVNTDTHYDSDFDSGEPMEVLDAGADDSPRPETPMDISASPVEESAPRSEKAQTDDGSAARWITAIVLVAMIAVASAVIWRIVRGHGDAGVVESLNDDGGVPAVVTPAAPRPAPVTPAVPESHPPVTITPKPETPSHIPKASLKILGAEMKVLADEVVPAPLGKVFLYVQVKVYAGQDAVKIASAGKGVALNCDVGEIFSAGLADDGSGMPAPARQAAIVVEAISAEIVTFVFIVPDGAFNGGKLTIAGVGEGDLPAISAPDVVSDIAGEYVEAGRYLRLEFDNPIMERLRAGGVHRLVMEKKGGNLTLAMPPTGLKGVVLPGGDVVIFDGQNHLKGKLRAFDSGKRLVLYLSEKPYHQIIYNRK